jgi:hypothetical protein
MSALPLAASGGDYLAAAYLAFLAIVLLYVVIIATKISRIERELEALNELADKRAG